MTTVISVENLSKVYRLGQIGTGTISYDLQLWWAKMRGKPNPRLRIGETDHGNRDGDDLWALNDVSFTVKQGEVLGIIGKNGAGKSTLLKILSRVTAPTSGRVRVKGRIASLLEVGTGFHPELTGRENTYLNGAILGMSRGEIDRKFDEIVDFSGVEKFIDTPVKRYSSGMYVRLAFAVAAHLEPEILLVDEVLAVGDAEFQKKCLGEMGEVAREGRTVLFVSHNMGAINILCTQAMLISKGEIVNIGTTNTVTGSYLDGISNVGDSTFFFEPKQNTDAYFTKVYFGNLESDRLQTFGTETEICIGFEFEVIRQIKGLEISFGLFDRNGNKVFRSGSMQKVGQQKYSKGTYRAQVKVPRNFIAPGKYYVSPALHIPNMQLFDQHEKTLNFSIIDTGSSNFSYSGNDLGVVLTALDWEIE